MHTNRLVSLSLIALLMVAHASPAWGLTRFPNGQCQLEGYLVKALNQPSWYFVINTGSDAETRFKLMNGPQIPSLNPNGQFVRVILTIPAPTESLYGEATLLKVDQILNPYRAPAEYHSTEAALKACGGRTRDANAGK
jgi:hypothetical protein